MIAKILFPRAKTGVSPAGRSDAEAEAIGGETKGEAAGEIPRVECDVAGVALRGASTPQQPRTDLALVVRNRSVL